jgi:hypothetical protein
MRLGLRQLVGMGIVASASIGGAAHGAVYVSSVSQTLTTMTTPPIFPQGLTPGSQNKSNQTLPILSFSANASSGPVLAQASQTAGTYVGPTALGGANATPGLSVNVSGAILANGGSGGSATANSTFSIKFVLDTDHPFTFSRSNTSANLVKSPSTIIQPTTGGTLTAGEYTASFAVIGIPSNSGFSLVVTPVPEPTTLVAACMMGLMMLRVRR